MNIEVIGEVVTVRLEGKMYVQESIEVREKVLKQLEKGYTQLSVDLTNLSYIDSSGLGVLIGFHKKMSNIGGSFVITGVHGAVKEVIELTRLHLVFDIQ
ncbi:STAS domain-containing protein [Bacillus alkalicellulosilyticus]|uniref:STAS domain-containing protein n=1 Tax=Alkalihalobacterium alkalicellulosilyticum TaxID=1912214 RepID=UPI00148292FC|nr:STAS domain-containing protein [Bacillus alkalicellulosilyticus]